MMSLAKLNAASTEPGAVHYAQGSRREPAQRVDTRLTEWSGVLFVLRQLVGRVHKTSGWIELVVGMREAQPQE